MSLAGPTGSLHDAPASSNGINLSYIVLSCLVVAQLSIGGAPASLDGLILRKRDEADAGFISLLSKEAITYSSAFAVPSA